MMHELKIAGETLLLLAQKAICWPRRKLLIIADIHFGKATSFRALGVPVPRGTTSQNLAMLDILIEAHDIEHVIFLGDFLHAKAAHASATLQVMTTWRERNSGLRLTLVRGNHDRHAGDPAPQLNIEIVDEPYSVAPFWFCHHPDLVAPGYVLAGHIHPVYRLKAGRESLRLPCFMIGARRAILPSFGAFTGGFLLTPEADDAIFLASEDAVFPVKR